MTARPKHERPETMDVALTELVRIMEHLRSKNKEAWADRWLKNRLSERSVLDRAALRVARYLFTEGPQPEWTLTADTKAMGLTKEGFRAGLTQAISLGLITEGRIRIDDGECSGWQISSSGIATVMAEMGERDVLAQIETESKSATSDEPLA